MVVSPPKTTEPYAVSNEEIAETAGYSIGALYSNFEGKDHLFLELLSSRAGDRVAAAAEAIATAGGEGYTAARGLGRVMADAADNDVRAAALHAEFWLYAVRNPAVMATLSDGMRATHRSLQQLILSEFRRRGTHAEHPPIERIATVVFALYEGLVEQRRIDRDAVPEQLFEDALTWLFTGLAYAGAEPADPPDA
ncbi:TetR/AcrR family transcriptional regulator [Nocardia sp. alder85J]|uniref:TetR/AcrR family transcriptional regulator n=1 Tax=Nocardia sp. alder85J TaxID=2862949 RepID=UPI001CD376DD